MRKGAPPKFLIPKDAFHSSAAWRRASFSHGLFRSQRR
jgi:hypothetical protein